MPELSIIIPCFNHGKVIDEALNSVFEQSYNDYEVIVINDGSTDGYTNEKLSELERKGVFVLHQPNQGLATARNNGIKLAKGEYILPLDSDNRLKKDCISFFLDELKKSGADIIYGDAEFFGDKEGKWESGKFDIKKLMANNYIDACSIYRKNVWSSIGGYDPNMPVMGYEDWDFWLNAAFKKFKFRYFEKIFFDYRSSSESMIKTISEENRRKVFAYVMNKYSSEYYQMFYKYYRFYEHYFEKRNFKTSVKLFLSSLKLVKPEL